MGLPPTVTLTLGYLRLAGLCEPKSCQCVTKHLTTNAGKAARAPIKPANVPEFSSWHKAKEEKAAAVKAAKDAEEEEEGEEEEDEEE